MKTRNTIELVRDRHYAPCCFLLVRVDENGERLPYTGDHENNSVLVQSDYDFPGIARNFGWNDLDENNASGDEIALASEWLCDNAGGPGWQGIRCEDPGYFSE